MSMITYQAQHTVHLGQIKSEVRAGETFQFDGQTIVLRGETHLLPSIKVAIDQGWFKQVDTPSVNTSSTKKASATTTGKLKAPIVQDQMSKAVISNQASSTPTLQKEAQVRSTDNVSGTNISGFKPKVVRSDEDQTQTESRSFSSGVLKPKATNVSGSSQEGQVVNKVFKTSTSNKLTINNDSDLSRETAALEKISAASAPRTGFVESRESQTVKQTGRIERTASDSGMDTDASDGSFVTQTSDGVTMKVQGSFNRKNMKVISMEGDTFMDEYGVGAKVVGKAKTPAIIQKDAVTQSMVDASESGKVVDVTTKDQKPFVWDMSKHWKTRVREASQYKNQPDIYNQIIAQETETVVKHLKS